jgi:hypothetical protein
MLFIFLLLLTACETIATGISFSGGAITTEGWERINWTMVSVGTKVQARCGHFVVF